jgi:hypothetical protein
MPQTAAPPAATVLTAAQPPTVQNFWQMLTISIPLVTQTSQPVQNVLLIGATLDGTLPPQLALPWFIGNVAPAKETRFNVAFPIAGLVVGSQHSVAVTGTYQTATGTSPFTFNFSVTVPPPRTMPSDLLNVQAEVSVDLAGGVWSYTLLNNELQESGRSVTSFQLRLAAPFVVKGTPQGWAVQTDNLTYVLWHLAEPVVSNAAAVPPGASLTGFVIQSASTTSQGTTFTTASFNATTQKATAGAGTVLAPTPNR